MKKLFKLLSLLIIPLLLFTNTSHASYDPILRQPLLDSNYYTITNDPDAPGTIKTGIEFIERFSGEGTETLIGSIQYSVKSTGAYTAGAISWKTSRMFVAVTFFNPVTKKVESMGYQFKPVELITANNTVTTVTINKDQLVSGIMRGMNAETDLIYANPDDRNALMKAIEYGFENGCGLRVNAEVAKFRVPAGFQSNRLLLADDSNIVGTPIMVNDFSSSEAANRARLRSWAVSNPHPFSFPDTFVNDAITRAKGSVGDPVACLFRAELAMADTIFQSERTSFTDGSGTLRDKLEVYTMDGVQIMGDTLNPGQRYRMCSYILNAGTTDTTREVLPEFYMVKNDVRNFTIPNHMKENLGTSQANLN